MQTTTHSIRHDLSLRTACHPESARAFCERCEGSAFRRSRYVAAVFRPASEPQASALRFRGSDLQVRHQARPPHDVIPTEVGRFFPARVLCAPAHVAEGPWQHCSRTQFDETQPTNRKAPRMSSLLNPQTEPYGRAGGYRSQCGFCVTLRPKIAPSSKIETSDSPDRSEP